MAVDLILVLRDFFTTEPLTRGSEPRARLAALERMLATAQHSRLGSDWRAALAERLSPPGCAGLSRAQLVARALGGSQPGESGCWLATPMHYFAGLDSVHLHPAGLIELEPEVQATLAADFDRLFADGPWRLCPTGHRELLLTGPKLQADGADPARWLGSRLEGPLYTGADASQLRRLIVELEMWLHEHPINRAREQAGHLRIIGLWPWGGEPLALPANSSTAAGTPAVLWGRDTFAEALWRLAGARHEPHAPADAALLGTQGLHVVLLPGGPSWEGLFEDLERRWLAPALGALRAGTIGTLELWAGTHAFRLRRLHLARFWRGRASWHEALA